MTERLSEYLIVWTLAEAACQRISRRAIRQLQRISEGLQFGDDSGLMNVWEEVCVQIQGQRAVIWSAYEQVVTQVLSSEVAKLPSHEREAIWLQTREGENWDQENEESRRPYPVAEDDIIEHVRDVYLYAAAGDWSNLRIRNFLEQRCWM